MRPSSRQNVIWFCRASLAVICLYALTNSSWSEEQVIDEVVIDKWKAYERFARSLQGTGRISTVYSGPGAPRERLDLIVLKQNQNCISLNYCNSLEEKPSELIRVANPKYAAFLKRSKSEPGNAVLERFDENPQRSRGEEKSFFEQSLQFTSPHFCIADRRPLSQILVDPRFKIGKISKKSENGRELVRMDYRAVIESVGNRSTAYSGWVDLDPSLCWCIVRAKEVSEVTNEGTRTMTIEIEVVEREMVNHPSGFPLMKRGKSRVTQHFYGRKEKTINGRTMPGSKEKTTNGRTTSDYEWDVNDRVPDSEFTLTAYGLPEPGGELVKQSLPLYVWIILAIGISFVLAVVFRILARRRACSEAAR